MGNCSVKGATTGECHHSIRILTDTGSILQFKGPKTVAEILESYHGYGVFRQGHPLQEKESLSYGFLYYLLPLKDDQKAGSNERVKNSVRVAACDYMENNGSSAVEVLPYSVKNGVWKVKLVIDTRHLEEILSEQVNTGALIEKMRMAATAYSTCSPTRSRRTMSGWKVGWKPTLFSTFLTPVKSGKIAVAAADGSILDLDSC